jgi:hypothetical protein
MGADSTGWLDGAPLTGPLLGEDWSINKVVQHGRRGWQSALRAFGYQAEGRRHRRRSIWQRSTAKAVWGATEMAATRW